MNTAPRLAVPQDDGSIQRALADLTTKFQKWSSAVDGLRALKARETQAGALSPAAPAAEVALPYFGHIRAAEVPDITSGVNATAAGIAQQTPADSPPADDEALLEALDPEVANYIRVRRRLADRNMSVRELLVDYHLRPPAAGRRGKTWFSWMHS